MARFNRKQAKQKLLDILDEFHGCKVEGAKVKSHVYLWSDRSKLVWPIIAEMGWSFEAPNGSSGGAVFMRGDEEAAPVILAAESYLAALVLNMVDFEEQHLRNLLAGDD